MSEPVTLKAEIERLQRFKDFVHQRLDAAGVEKDPPGPHRDAGCRIGQRLDLVLGASPSCAPSDEKDGTSAWLIEWPADNNLPARWWHPVDGWMLDASKATRFARKCDADGYLKATMFGIGTLITTEHKWVGAAVETSGWRCKANRTADPPQDCDWPHCGCDDAALKVIEALVEEGWSPPQRGAEETNASPARPSSVDQFIECCECGSMVLSKSAGGYVTIEDFRAERAEVERLTLSNEILRQTAQDLAARRWIAVANRAPSTTEPVVYARPKLGQWQQWQGGWHVGIAYWTVSKKWNPELNSEQSPLGFTHWMPLPDAPT